MLDLNEIALFVHVVRAGSFAEAARRLGIPSNTLSRRIQKLEQHLGVRLLQRSTRRLSLSAAGRSFHERCAEQVVALADAAQDLSAGSQEPAGNVRVAVPADFFDWFQLEWIREFLDAFPQVRLEFLLSDAMLDLIAAGVDVALRGGKIEASSLVIRQFASSQGRLVASPRYLAERGMPKSLGELASHDCLTASRASGLTTWQLQGPEGASEIRVSGRFQADTVQALVKAAVSGLGIALLPDLLVARHLREKTLIEVLPAYVRDAVGIAFVYPSERQLPRAVAAFVEFSWDRMAASGLIEQRI
jgi:DNA-binding transcriptional LysR family regulator